MSTVYDIEYKPGTGWIYDDKNITYDDLNELITYDAIGVATSWGNEAIGDITSWTNEAIGDASSWDNETKP